MDENETELKALRDLVDRLKKENYVLKEGVLSAQGLLVLAKDIGRAFLKTKEYDPLKTPVGRVMIEIDSWTETYGEKKHVNGG